MAAFHPKATLGKACSPTLRTGVTGPCVALLNEGWEALMLTSVRAGLMAGLLLASSAKLSNAQEVLDVRTRGAVVTKLAEALRQRYVYPEMGTKLAETLTTNLHAGAYDALSEPAQFAARLQADLYAVAHDKHLNVEAPNTPQPSDLPKPPVNEAGVVRADRLGGDIGYIAVVGFPPLPLFKLAADRAMSALSGSKALIIDVRGNYGGDPASVAYLVSFLVPTGTHINDIVLRTVNTVDFTRQTFNAHMTPLNFIGRPIYVLTSKTTFSGGEELAYDLQNLKVATIVGETTGGGANPTGRIPISENLTAFVPFGRAENPVTKTNWNGKGVIPDVATAAPEALKVALARLGQPAVSDIAAVSKSQVFVPRTDR
jgi:hypothetical protein